MLSFLQYLTQINWKKLRSCTIFSTPLRGISALAVDYQEIKERDEYFYFFSTEHWQASNCFTPIKGVTTNRKQRAATTPPSNGARI